MIKAAGSCARNALARGARSSHLVAQVPVLPALVALHGRRLVMACFPSSPTPSSSRAQREQEQPRATPAVLALSPTAPSLVEAAVAAVARALRRWWEALTHRSFPMIAVRATPRNIKVLSRLTESLRRALKPSIWAALSTGNLTTVLGVLRPSFLRYRRQMVGPLSDGGTVAVDWLESAATRALPPSAPVILLCHGINGSSGDPYIKTTARVACAAPFGMRVAAFNMRGCGGQRLTSPRGYSAADTEDLAAAIAACRAAHPAAPIACIGFSLGGNLLCK